MIKGEVWLEKAYKTFAYEGPTGLKVERLAREVGKSKSSFYHHFADLDVFTEHLLDYHYNMAIEMANREANAKDVDELIEIIIEFKLDLLFNRQLRIHRENKDFEKCFCAISAYSLPKLLGVWKKIIGLEDQSYLAEMVLNLSIENFFLQITDETINNNWLSNYFQNIKLMVAQFKKSNKNLELNDTV
ncbi:MAG: TetR/AcrR family transcriptional regulator [Bacteroidia bacterium]